jgi:hypothetical protein
MQYRYVAVPSWVIVGHSVVEAIPPSIEFSSIMELPVLSVSTVQLQAGELLGFHCSRLEPSVLKAVTRGDDSDWRGLCIGDSEVHAEGYLFPNQIAAQEQRLATIYRVTLLKPLPIRFVDGGVLRNSSISEDIKAEHVKAALGVPEKSLIMAHSAENGYIYSGPEAEGHIECIIPYSKVPEWLAFEPVISVNIMGSPNGLPRVTSFKRESDSWTSMLFGEFELPRGTCSADSPKWMGQLRAKEKS